MVQRREINLIGHMMYVWEDFEDAIRLMHEGKITISKTVSQIYPFSQYQEALNFADEHPADVMKMIIKM
jgi:L-iditol 2-dehydrogenase